MDTETPTCYVGVCLLYVWVCGSTSFYDDILPTFFYNVVITESCFTINNDVMRNIIFIVMVLISISANAQEFKFEKIIETNKNQSESYSAAKEFVADFWNMAKVVTQNQDDDAFLLQIKAQTTQEVKVGMGLACVYDYKYTVKIQTKDKRCRIQIYDIICEDAYQTGLGTQNKIPKIQPFLGDEPEQKTKSLGKGLSKKKAVEMMNDLKTFFESIINGLEKEINDTTDDNW